MASQPLYRSAAPRAVLGYGLLGVVPFVAAPIAALLQPGWAGVAAVAAAGYGALILSFLGGARWGLEVGRERPGLGIVSLAMLPTLVGLALLLLPEALRTTQLWGIALALAGHWLWDVRSAGLPGWYAGLRTRLSAAAVAGLAVMALIIGRGAP